MADLKSILDRSTAPEEVKHDVWNLYHEAQGYDDFRAAFDAFPIEEETKHELWNLKFGVPTPSEAVVKTTGEIGRGAAGLASDMALPTLGGAAGGLIGTAGGIPGIATGAATGAAAGEAATQELKKRGYLTLGRPPAETYKDYFTDVMLAGAGGVAQEGPKMLAAVGKLPAFLAKSDTEYQQLAKEFGIPLTWGQQHGGARREFEALVRRSFMSASVFRRFDIEVNKRLLIAARKIGDSIADAVPAVGPMRSGEFIQRTLKSVHDSIGPAYRNFLEQEIFPAVGSAQLEVTGTLQSTAKHLLNSIKQPTEFAQKARKIDAVQDAMGLLEDFADPYVTVKTGILDESGTEIVRREAKKLTFQDAHLLRSLLFDISHSGQSVIGKGKIKMLNGALHGQMMKAAEKAGGKSVAKSFASASSTFRESMDLFESTILKSLINKKAYEGVLGTMLSTKSSGTAMMQTLRALGKDERAIQGIRRVLWDEVVGKTTKNKVFVGDVLETYLENLGDETVSLLFGAKADDVMRFSRILDNVSLDPRLTKPFSSSSIMAMGQSRAFNPVDVARGGWVSIGSLAASILTLGPMGAKIMSSKAVTEGFLKAAQSPRLGVKTANRLMAAISKELFAGKMTEDRPWPQLPPPPVQ